MLIRSSDITREQLRNTQRNATSNLNMIQPTAFEISHPQNFREVIFLNVIAAICLLMHSSPKFNQIIRYNQRTTTSNLNVSKPTVQKISHPQFFWATIFSRCPPSAILFSMHSTQKLMRSSEIPREPPHQIWIWSIQLSIPLRYRAGKRFGRPFFSIFPLLFIIEFFLKLIRLSDISREPLRQIWMW